MRNKETLSLYISFIISVIACLFAIYFYTIKYSLEHTFFGFIVILIILFLSFYIFMKLKALIKNELKTLKETSELSLRLDEEIVFDEIIYNDDKDNDIYTVRIDKEKLYAQKIKEASKRIIGNDELSEELEKDLNKIFSSNRRGQNFGYSDIEDEKMESVENKSVILRYIISAFLIIGLLGSFLGLTVTIDSLSSILGKQLTIFEKQINTDDEENIGQEEKIELSKIIIPLKNMSITFGTSIVGILASVLFGFTFSVYEKLVLKRSKKYSELIDKYGFEKTYPTSTEITTQNIRELSSNLGKIIESFDSNSKNLADSVIKIQKINNEVIKEYGGGYELLRETIQTQLIEPIKNVTDDFKTLATDNYKKYIETIEVKLNDKMSEHNNKIGNMINSIEENIKNTGEYINKLNNVISGVENEIKDISEKPKKFSELFKKNEDIMSALIKHTEYIGTITTNITASMSKLSNSIENLVLEGGDGKNPIENINNELRELKIETINMMKVMKGIRKNNKLIKNIVNSIKEVNELEKKTH